MPPGYVDRNVVLPACRRLSLSNLHKAASRRQVAPEGPRCVVGVVFLAKGGIGHLKGESYGGEIHPSLRVELSARSVEPRRGCASRRRHSHRYSTIRIPGSVVCGAVCQVRAACCPRLPAHRSEERRVGKEGRSLWEPH